MAIIMKSIKFILLFTLTLFLIHSVSAGTGIFSWSGADVNTNTSGTGGSTAGTFYISYITVNDAGALSEMDYVMARLNNDTFSHKTTTSQWVACTYKIGAVTVGTGTFGYLNNGDGSVTIASFMNDDFSLGGYSGTQHIEIDSSLNIRFQLTGDASRTAIQSYNLLDQSAGMAYIGYLQTNYVVGHDSATTLHTAQTTYSHSNSYTYSGNNATYLYFYLNRDAETQLKLIINNSYEDIVNESSLQSSDLEILWPDTTNNTWSITAINVYGDSDTDIITIVYEDAPLAEDTIEWGADSYVVDDTGSYSWSLSDSNWDTWLYSKKASIYRDETLVHEVSLSEQADTFYYTFEEEGSFTVKLRHTSALLPHVTIDTDTVLVSPIGESYISVTNTTIYINTPIGFQFSYGFTPLPVSPGVWSSATSIEARKLIDGDWITVNRWFYPDLDSVTPNVLYTYTIGTIGVYSDSMLTSEGEYIFYLTDFNHGDVASTNVYTVEYQSGMPTENITTTYLNILSGETYLFDDLFTFKCGIDNTNFTNGINYIEIYNYDHDIITQSALLFKQSWYKDGYIFPMTDEDPTEQFQYGIIIAFPGNNTMRIRHDDINGSTELVHDNFTLSENNIRGYGLKLSAYEACINEAVTIWVTIPSDSNLTIYSPTGTEIKTYNLNASTTITYYFPVSGQYDLKLVPSGLNYAERTATIYISDCADDGIIEPPSGEIDDMYLNMFNFMTLPIFWGMIIFVGFIGGLSMKTNRNGDHLVSGNGLAFIAFGLLNLLAFIGMLAPYTMYAIVSTWIFAGIFFGVGRYLARGE